MTSMNQTPGGYKFAPLVATVVNHGERTKTSPLALGYPLLRPSRHVRVYYCTPLSSPGFLCSDPFRHETFRPFFRRPAQFPLVLDCSRPLVGVDAESSEVVQETPHPVFFLGSPRSPRPPPILRTSRTSAVSYRPCAPQIPRTRSASCVKSPRCSHLPS